MGYKTRDNAKRCVYPAEIQRWALPGLLFAVVLAAPVGIEDTRPDYRLLGVFAGLYGGCRECPGRIAVAFAHTTQRSGTFFFTGQILEKFASLAGVQSLGHAKSPCIAYRQIVADLGAAVACTVARRLIFPGPFMSWACHQRGKGGRGKRALTPFYVFSQAG